MPGRLPIQKTDTVVVALLILIVTAASLYRSARVPDGVYDYNVNGHSTSDLWFDGDLPRMMCLATDRTSPKFITSTEHPLAPVFTFIPVSLIRYATGLSPIDAVRGLVAAQAALFATICFVLFRLMRCRPIDALAFAALAAVSASGMAWSMVAELHLPAAITLMIPLCLVAARSAGWRASDAAYLAASACSLSVTITCWMSGIGAALVERGRLAALQISVNALVLVAVLWLALSVAFPEMLFFVGNAVTMVKFEETQSPHPIAAFVGVFSHTIVMPAISFVESPMGTRDLSVQNAWPGSSGPVGVVATVLWAAVLAIGAREAARKAHATPFRTLLLAVLAGQVLLHAIFGRETFLFSIQVVPLLTAVAAYGCLGHRRALVLALTGALLVMATVNNWRQLDKASSLAAQRIADVHVLPPLPAEFGNRCDRGS